MWDPSQGGRLHILSSCGFFMIALYFLCDSPGFQGFSDSENMLPLSSVTSSFGNSVMLNFKRVDFLVVFVGLVGLRFPEFFVVIIVLLCIKFVAQFVDPDASFLFLSYTLGMKNYKLQNLHASISATRINFFVIFCVFGVWSYRRSSP